nr:DNA replication/repair protein RecF [Nakamurella flavida]
MSLADYRSWPTADLTLEPGITVLVGRNGAGKTNLVEALGYLATLSSHRVATDVPLIARGTERAIVRAAVISQDRELLLEVEIAAGRANKARINRSPLRRTRDLLGVLRTVLFAPEDLALVRGDPGERRRYLDELLVMRAPRLAGTRAEYDRILKQRNALLKSAGPSRRGPAPPTLDVWDEHLAAVGGELLEARVALVEELRPYVVRAYRALAGDPGAATVVDLVYRPSVPTPEPTPIQDPGPDPADVADPELDLAPSEGRSDWSDDPEDDRPPPDGSPPENGPTDDPVTGPGEPEPTGQGDRPAAAPTADAAAWTAAMTAELARRRTAELDRGVSLVGPHRDDLEIVLGGGPAKGFASHGESWSLALALRLAAFGLLRSDGVDPVLILDDVFAELDSRRRERLALLIADADQVLITAAVTGDVPPSLGGRQISVADGTITPVDRPDPG